MTYFPITPCRVVDTRLGSGSTGRLMAGTERPLNFVGICGIPAEARAYAANVTVLPRADFIPQAVDQVTVWPDGYARPSTPSILDPEGRLVSNHLIIPASNTGQIKIHSTHDTEFFIDLNGYWKVSDAGLDFFPVPPCRLVDTRYVSATRCGTIPKDAGAYVLNLTVKPTTTLGFLTIWPNNGSASGMPVVSNLNDLDGRWLSNNTIVQNINGTLNVFATDETDLVVDVTGYFAPRRSVGYGMVLSTLFPCRIVNNAPSSYEFPGRVSSCGVPDQAEALALNVTIRPPPPPNNQFGYLTLWPAGTMQPIVSIFNALEGNPVSNGVLALLGSAGRLTAFGTNPAGLDVDVTGYFTHPPSAVTVTEVNLGGVPIDRYFLTNGNNGDNVPACPPAMIIRTCYEQMLKTAPGNYFSQNVRGVRFQFGMMGGQGSTVWEANGTVRPAWVNNFRAFLLDLKSWGIQRVSVTPALWGWGDPEYLTGAMDCSGTSQLRFHKWLPFGISTATGLVDCYTINQGYSLAKRGPSFWTWVPYVQMWANIFAEISAAQLEVSAIDMSNELDIMNFPAQARLIYDCEPGFPCFDVLGAVRTAAAANGIDSWRVTFSTSEKRPVFPNESAGASGANINTNYCDSVYGDSALVILQSQLNSAFDGLTGFFGFPAGQSGIGAPGYFLHCNTGSIPGASSLTKRYDKPRVVDFHSYPCVEIENQVPSCSSINATVVANKIFSALWDSMNRTGQSSATAVIGETHSNQDVCDGYTAAQAGQTVLGLKDSTLYSGHKWNLIVRPWNNPSQQNPPDPPDHLVPWSCYNTPWPTVPPYLFP